MNINRTIILAYIEILQRIINQYQYIDNEIIKLYNDLDKYLLSENITEDGIKLYEKRIHNVIRLLKMNYDFKD